MHPKLKLHYFDAKGRAEPIRLILKHAKIPFEDIKMTHAEWAEKKPKFDFQMVPVLEADGVQISETLAIIHYVSKLANIVPENPLDAAIADCLVCALSDCITGIVPYIKAPEDKKKEVAEECFKTVSSKLLQIEAFLKKHQKDKFVVGGKVSHADYTLYTMMNGLEMLPVGIDAYLKKNCPTIIKLMQQTEALIN